MNKYIRPLSSNGDCELIYLRPFYNLDRDNIHYVNDYDEEKIGVNVFALYEENQELKKQLEEKQNPLKGIFAQVNDDTLLRDCGNMNAEINKLKNQQKEFIEYLENEKDRLSRECSQIYEDSLGKTRLVNKDIFNEVDKILLKYKEIILGDK